MVQIENKEGVSNVREIASVDGIGSLIDPRSGSLLNTEVRCLVYWALRSFHLLGV